MPYTRSNRISLKSPPPSSELARNTMLIAESEGWLTTLPAQRDSESCSSCSKKTDHSPRAHVPVVWSPRRVSTRFTSVPSIAVPYGTSGLRWSSPSLHNPRHLTPTEPPGCLAGTALAALDISLWIFPDSVALINVKYWQYLFSVCWKNTLLAIVLTPVVSAALHAALKTTLFQIYC